MEPTLSCEVLVLDQNEQPIEGASILFQPNQRWFNFATQLFGTETDSLARTRKLLAKEKLPPFWQDSGSTSRLSQKSNAQGRAFITNLPAGSLEEPAVPRELRLSVGHKDYSLVTDPPNSSAPFPMPTAQLLPNQPNRVTVRMQKK
jgi:hypothetical protein